MSRSVAIVDSHQHFWTLERDDYDWLTPELSTLYRDFLPGDLKPMLDEAGVSSTVLVQAAPTVDETRFLLTIAEQHDFVAGVVGWIDMNRGLDAILELDALSNHRKFVGIRPMIQNIDNQNWMLERHLSPVFEALEYKKLCFDALVYPDHLPNLLQLLRRHADLKVVVDHGAKPAIRDQKWGPWANDVALIADSTTAFCKLSGLITEASSNQNYDDSRPYFEHLLSCFGAERLMWGSDWPVLNLAGDYLGWLEICKSWSSQLSWTEQQHIFGRTATYFYLID